MAAVTMAECASKVSMDLLSLSLSEGFGHQMYAFLSSLPLITYLALSLKDALI